MFGRICCLEKRGWRVRLVREEILGLTLLRAEAVSYTHLTLPTIYSV